MRKSTLTFALLLASGATIATMGAVTAQEMQPPINADEVKWGPVPPNIPARAQIAVLLATQHQMGLMLFG